MPAPSWNDARTRCRRFRSSSRTTMNARPTSPSRVLRRVPSNRWVCSRRADGALWRISPCVLPRGRDPSDAVSLACAASVTACGHARSRRRLPPGLGRHDPAPRTRRRRGVHPRHGPARARGGGSRSSHPRGDGRHSRARQARTPAAGVAASTSRRDRDGDPRADEWARACRRAPAWSARRHSCPTWHRALRRSDGDGRVRDRQMQPLIFFIREGRWYLLGHDLHRRGWRVSRLDRITSATADPAVTGRSPPTFPTNHSRGGSRRTSADAPLPADHPPGGNSATSRGDDESASAEQDGG